jgi:hypothetical protein
MAERLGRAIAWWQIVCGVLGFIGLAIVAADWPSRSRRFLTDLYGPFDVVLSIAFLGIAIVVRCCTHAAACAAADGVTGVRLRGAARVCWEPTSSRFEESNEP